MTSFDTVIDSALVIVDDYKLANFYNKDIDGFKKYCDGFLLSAIPHFWQCRQALTYDADERQFDNELTDTEIGIIADWWVITWWEREKNNAAQVQLKLKVGSAFTFNSEAQNMKEKSAIIDKLREEVDRRIRDYQLMDLDAYM